MPLLTGYPFRISYGANDDRLHEFYLPALERCVRFDRATGFFSSAALAIAAAGIVRLIRNGGHMRLLCGARLAADDVEAIRKGQDLSRVVGDAMVGCLVDASDTSMRARLEALAWMVAHDSLEIRVVLPKGQDGLPLRADEAREYYHPKEGVFLDAQGNRLAFSGSSNDSVNGWQWNYETFAVYTTWPRGDGQDQTPPLPQFVRSVERRFEALWGGVEESWVALPVPEAARRQLLSYCPAVAPEVDPLEQPAPTPVPPVPENTPDAAERALFLFLREAPFLPNADTLGAETAAVRPWPHQAKVVEELVASYPASRALCDEVGLGKSVEAGLALRQLLISGRVSRVLLLAPKSVLQQWQEELYEKVALNVPRYDEREVRDVFGSLLPYHGPAVWSENRLLIASSQLAKRRERQDELLSAEPWDLVIVDEAHHARRRDFLRDRYRPNRLLELLAGTPGRRGLKDRTACLYLLTATPMQLDPVEVWDLLKLLRLGGRWGAGQDDFLRFFGELRKPAAERDWDFLLTMMQDYLEGGGRLDDIFCRAAERELGPVEWDLLQHLPSAFKRTTLIGQLSPRARAYLHEMVRRHTPVKSLVFRSTRTLLRTYRQKGILKAKVPTRKPANVWIQLRDEERGERQLYDRIDQYISEFYQKYEAERKGLGFVMTVYRRRLTSSFHALRCSLGRRLAFLKGLSGPAGMLSDEDVEGDELELDISESETVEERERCMGELEYLADFITDVDALTTDSKLEQLLHDLAELFRRRETVLVFTQYADTMDYLRDQLGHIYGRQIACYSGRGGERWDGALWVRCSKEEVKTLFRQGEEIKLLLCTESASEGLNLQTCGVLVNYDMPWNPMRVEQRIGRIDRIGQEHDDVWIRNYFYADTVEAIVYQRLGDRIAWFEDVVGELQPILQRVGRTISEVAMLKGEARARRLDEEVAAIREEIETRATEALNLDNYVDDSVVAPARGHAPVTLPDLERCLVASKMVGHRFTEHPSIPGAYMLTCGVDRRAVTFKPEVFDAHPYRVRFLTYGDPLLAELLEGAGPPAPGDGPRGVAWLRRGPPRALSMFVACDGGDVRAVDTVIELQGVVSRPSQPWPETAVTEAQCRFSLAKTTLDETQRHLEQARHDAERLSLRAEAAQIVKHTALIDIVLSQTPDLFAERPPRSFGDHAVLALREEGVPFKGLLALVGPDVPLAEPSDPFYLAIQGQHADSLRRRRESLAQQGIALLHRYRGLVSVPSANLARPDGEDAPLVWLCGFDVSIGETSPEPPQPDAGVLPFKVVSEADVLPFVNAIPVYPLQVAAGIFSATQDAGEAPDMWVEPSGRTRPRHGLFVSRVVGESMNRRIPSGSWCVFRHPVEGSRDGKVVLAQLHGVTDPEHGGRYTVKIYHSTKRHHHDGSWSHVHIELAPDSGDPGFSPLRFDGLEQVEGVTIVAELVEVLGCRIVGLGSTPHASDL